MPKEVIVELINSKRMEIKAKGYIKPSEAGTYCGVSKERGREIYKQIEKELIANGQKINSCGISPKAFNDYLGITDEQIYENYKLGYWNGQIK